jgi:hypothetical protein
LRREFLLDRNDPLADLVLDEIVQRDASPVEDGAQRGMVAMDVRDDVGDRSVGALQVLECREAVPDLTLPAMQQLRFFGIRADILFLQDLEPRVLDVREEVRQRRDLLRETVRGGAAQHGGAAPGATGNQSLLGQPADRSRTVCRLASNIAQSSSSAASSRPGSGRAGSPCAARAGWLSYVTALRPERRRQPRVVAPPASGPAR